jgi:hypothetical protein
MRLFGDNVTGARLDATRRGATGPGKTGHGATGPGKTGIDATRQGKIII